MMVKNEENNLERCLTSLSEMLKERDVELIIVDTGSSDGTVEIAKKYTDRVYFHQWNNNFSEMRNITISYATGEWIFIIDADEELKDAYNIISFLRKDKLSQVVCGALKLINVKRNNAERIATTLLSQRVFLNNGKFHYEGSVHNIPIIDGFTEEIFSTIMHYGYNADDAKLMESKFIRTSSLLIEELKKNPNNIYYIYQLSVTYHMHNEHQKALVEIIKAYELIKNSNKEKKKSSYIFVQLIKCYLLNNYFVEAINASIEASEIEPENFDIYFFMASAYLQNNQDFEGIAAYKKYFELIERYEELDIRKNMSIQTSSNTNESYIEANNNMAVIYYKNEMYNDAYIYVKQIIENNSLNHVESARNIKKMYLELCLRNGYISDAIDYIIKYYNELYYDFISFSEEFGIFVNRDNLHLIKQIPGEYKEFVQIKYVDTIADSNELTIFSKFLSMNNILFPPYSDELLYFALLNKVDISNFVEKNSEENLLKLFSYNSLKHPDFSFQILDYYEKVNSDDFYNEINVKRIILKFLAFMYSNEDALKIKFKYLVISMKYIKNKYNDLYIEGNYNKSDLSEEERFLMFLYTTLNELDVSELVSELKLKQNQFLNMSDIINLLIDYYGSVKMESNNLALEIELIKQLKVLKSHGKHNEILKIVNEVRTLLVDSPFMEAVFLKYEDI